MSVYLAMRYMGPRASEAVPMLLYEIRTKKSEDWTILVAQLGKIKDKRAVGPLLDIVDGRDSYAALVAAEALGDIGGEEAAEGIKRLLNKWEKEGRKDDNFAYGIAKNTYKNATGQEYRRDK